MKAFKDLSFLVVIVALLAACGGQPTAVTPPTATAPPAGETAAPAPTATAAEATLAPLDTAEPAATTAAGPLLEPPGVRVTSHGFFAGPKAEFSFDEPIANSSMLVLPTTIAPAA